MDHPQNPTTTKKNTVKNPKTKMSQQKFHGSWTLKRNSTEIWKVKQKWFGY